MPNHISLRIDKYGVRLSETAIEDIRRYNPTAYINIRQGGIPSVMERFYNGLIALLQS